MLGLDDPRRFLGIEVRQARPTRRHRLAVWQGANDTVYAINDQGQERYFDLNYHNAIAWAGVTGLRDPRTSPHAGALALYILKSNP